MGRLVAAMFTVVVLAAPGPLRLQQGPLESEARAAAEAMVNRFADSWNRADGAAYGENYWPDAELVDPTGHISEGRAAIVQEHVDLWAGPFKGTRQKCTVRRVTILCSNYIVVDFDADLSGVRQAPPGATAPGGVLHAHLKHVMQKRGDSWKVLLAQNTLVASPK